jgi:hypothetical protein
MTQVTSSFNAHTFEFSDTGDNRRKGSVVLLGRTVVVFNSDREVLRFRNRCRSARAACLASSIAATLDAQSKTANIRGLQSHLRAPGVPLISCSLDPL